jgi:hypothetical protein
MSLSILDLVLRPFLMLRTVERYLALRLFQLEVFLSKLWQHGCAAMTGSFGR